MNLKHVFVVSWVMGIGLAGCASQDEPDWQYDRADIEAAVFGPWSGTITPMDEEAAPFSLTIRSHDDVARTAACGSRSLSEDEATPGLGVRCLEITSMTLSATVVGDRPEPDEADGSFVAYGETFNSAEVWFKYRSSVARVLRANWDDERWSHCEIRDGVGSNNTIVAACTLDERVE